MDELRPCPFCGAPAQMRHVENTWWVECSDDNCPAFCSNTKGEAIAAWNRRADEDE
jgi:hypothetical protein